MSSNQTVGSLNIQLNMELAKMQAQIDSANQRIANMAKKAHGDVASMARNMNMALGTIGMGASVLGLIEFGRGILKLGDDINDLSKEAGLSTDAFQKMSEAGMDFDVSMEDIVKMSTKLRLAIQGALEGEKKSVENFAALGINVAALKRLAPEKQFEVIGMQIANAADKEQAFREGIDILGAKAGPKLLEFLKLLGTEGLDNAAKGFDAVRLSPEQLDTLDRAALKLKEIWLYTKLIGSNALLLATAKSSMDAQFIANPFGIPNVTGSPAVVPHGPSIAPGVGDGLADATRKFGFIEAITPALSEPVNRKMDIGLTLAQEDAGREKILRLIERQNAEEEAGYQDRRDNVAKLTDQVFKPYDKYLQKLRDDGIAMWEETRTPAEKYAEALREINLLEADGIITADTATRSRKKASEAAGQSVDMQKLWAEETGRIAGVAADNMTTAWVDALNGVEGGFENLGKVVGKEIEAMIARMLLVIPTMHAIGAIGGAMGFSTAAGSFFGAFKTYGGGKAGGGGVSAGSLHEVNELGTELLSTGGHDYLMMGANGGNITPNNKLSSLSGKSGDTYVIDARGADASQIKRLENVIVALNGSIEKRAVGAIRDAQRRGKV